MVLDRPCSLVCALVAASHFVHFASWTWQPSDGVDMSGPRVSQPAAVSRFDSEAPLMQGVYRMILSTEAIVVTGGPARAVSIRPFDPAAFGASRWPSTYDTEGPQRVGERDTSNNASPAASADVRVQTGTAYLGVTGYGMPRAT